jgi:hypothetical protein
MVDLGGAPLNNTNSLKYKTSEDRQALCDRYCAYLRKGGYPSYFPECSEKTIQRYRDEFPVDFPTEKIEEAERAYKTHYFDLLYEGATGKIERYNAPSAIFLAKNINKFRDTHDVTSGGETIKSPPPNIIVTDQETANFVKKMLSGSDDSPRP